MVRPISAANLPGRGKVILLDIRKGVALADTRAPVLGYGDRLLICS
jgi:hypothetical protein